MDRRSIALPRRPELSQHFFRDRAAVRRLVAQLPLAPGDLVLEIGPGSGILTDALAARACRVIAVEKDVRLYRRLRARFLGRTNVECHHGDILRFPLPRVPYRVVANVPYGASAAIVRRLLGAAQPPIDAHLVLQREAAEKFAGTPRETLFSLLAKPSFELAIVRRFRRADFEPRPSVDSVLLRITRRERPLLEGASRAAYGRFVRGCFGRGRADVRRTLRPWLTYAQVTKLGRALGFSPSGRPTDLSFEQWLGVFRFYEHVCLGRDPCWGPGVGCGRMGAGGWRGADC